MKGPKKDSRIPSKSSKAIGSGASPRTHTATGADIAGRRAADDRPERTGWLKEFVTNSPDETFEVGRSLAAAVEAPAVILLSGDLGAGKTVFAKGIGDILDIDPADVTSPSFTLVNVHEGRLRLYHVDLYRLDSVSYAGLGLEEMLADPNGIVVIEWAERLPGVTPGAINVGIEYLTENSRKIVISARTAMKPGQ